MKYSVNDIYTCVQGEGCQTGLAMVLLRLHGCLVGCPFCDTKETWIIDPAFEVGAIDEALGPTLHYILLHQSEILLHIKQNHPGPKWVLLTGGEPAEQDLGPLIGALHDGGYKTALETSGTAAGHMEADIDWVCVSPKIDMPGGKKILPEVLATADEIKHVVGKQTHIDQLDQLLENVKLKNSVEICLQPISQAARATELCIETVQERGWRLSLQTHKYLNLP